MKRRNFLSKLGMGIGATLIPVSMFGNDNTGYIYIELNPNEIVKVRKIDCYRDVTKVQSTQGRDVMVSIWNSYAHWGKGYSVTYRSLDGMYMGEHRIKSLRDDTRIVRTIPKVDLEIRSYKLEPKTIKLKNQTIISDKWEASEETKELIRKSGWRE